MRYDSESVSYLIDNHTMARPLLWSKSVISVISQIYPTRVKGGGDTPFTTEI